MMSAQHPGPSGEGPDGDVPPTELFSDAVLAIALPLLALDLTATGYHDGQLGSRLLDRWPAYVAFPGSFLLIAVMWLNHHAAFQRLRATPPGFLWANFGVLLGAVILPAASSPHPKGAGTAAVHGERASRWGFQPVVDRALVRVDSG